MSFDMPQRLRIVASRLGLVAAAIAASALLSACTTVEGTNAMTDIGTFEREVMTSTMQGMGLVPKESKDEKALADLRGPLVMPKDAASLPAPQPDTGKTMLPADSDGVRIDTASLTDADIQRLRNAKVVDLRSLSGRPLTEAETRALTARMVAANKEVVANGDRPLYLPPEAYFTTVGGVELICLAKSGELVSLQDKRCPEEIRKALRKPGPSAPPAN